MGSVSYLVFGHCFDGFNLFVRDDVMKHEEVGIDVFLLHFDWSQLEIGVTSIRVPALQLRRLRRVLSTISIQFCFICGNWEVTRIFLDN